MGLSDHKNPAAFRLEFILSVIFKLEIDASPLWCC